MHSWEISESLSQPVTMKEDHELIQTQLFKASAASGKL